MANFSTTATIGGRLFRNFGGGSDVRRVITETIGGQTFTRVLDAEGKVIANRVKEIERFSVGNKNVVRKTVREKNVNNRNTTITDRIFDKEGKFLGCRESEIRNYGKYKHIKKYTASGECTEKEMRNGITNKKWTDTPCCEVYYNNKGLPIPNGVDYILAKNKSLQEMLKMTGDEARYYGYYDDPLLKNKITLNFDLENYAKNMIWNI